jgi:hypothetical protein
LVSFSRRNLRRLMKLGPFGSSRGSHTIDHYFNNAPTIWSIDCWETVNED